MPTVTDPIHLRSAELRPASLDDGARTVRVTWASETPVRRRDTRGTYLEVLRVRSDTVRMDRLVGAPFLNGHRHLDTSAVLGVVADAGLEVGQAGREAWALVKFSERTEVAPIWQDIKAGILRHVSAGYTVERWEESVDPTSGERTRVAVAWTPLELSLVPVPADPAARIRQQEEHDMPTTTTATAESETVAETTADATAQNRGEINARIRSVASASGLDAEFTNALIDRGATIDEARAAIFDAMEGRAAPQLYTNRASVGFSNDDPNVYCTRMGEALFARVNPRYELSAPARQFAGLSIPELGREILRRNGLPVIGMSAAEIVTRALHTTGDFANILGDTVNRTLRSAYQQPASGIRMLAQQTTAPDFRTKYRVQFSEAPTLQKVSEHGEFTSGTMADGKESYAVDTYGRIIGFTRRAMVNDDLGAFADLSRRMAIAAMAFEAQHLVDLLEQNSGSGPTMNDGTALFHADHGNLASSGAAPGESTISAGRLAMRKQVGLTGELISVTPKYLVVPSDLETTAEKQLTAIQAVTVDEANPFAKLQLVVEPRLTSTTRWYIASSPAEIDGLEYAYLEGMSGPQITTKDGFAVDGVQIKVSLDYGAGFVEHRGWYSDPGS